MKVICGAASSCPHPALACDRRKEHEYFSLCDLPGYRCGHKCIPVAEAAVVASFTEQLVKLVSHISYSVLVHFGGGVCDNCGQDKYILDYVTEKEVEEYIRKGK